MTRQNVFLCSIKVENSCESAVRINVSLLYKKLLVPHISVLLEHILSDDSTLGKKYFKLRNPMFWQKVRGVRLMNKLA